RACQTLDQPVIGHSPFAVLEVEVMRAVAHRGSRRRRARLGSAVRGGPGRCGPDDVVDEYHLPRLAAVGGEGLGEMRGDLRVAAEPRPGVAIDGRFACHHQMLIEYSDIAVP